MSKQLCVLICLVALIFPGCARKWTLDTQYPLAQLAWPQPPEKPRIRQVMTIEGFKEKGDTIKGFFFGKEEGRLKKPVAVATGRDGRIAIADTGTHSVHLYIPKEEQYIGVYRFDAGEMVSPVSVAFDDELRLYVSDSFSKKIAVFDSKGKYLFSIDRTVEGVLKQPTGLAYDPGNQRVFAVETASHRINAFSPKGDLLFSFGARGTSEGQFNFPTHIFWSPAGLLYVTDSMNYRIQVFDNSGKFHSSFGHHGDGSGDFAMPKGVAVDREGIIYVVDTLFDNIQLFDERGEFLLTLGSRGTGLGRFWLPSGIFIDGSDKLYVCDTYNNRIQVFEILR